MTVGGAAGSFFDTKTSCSGCHLWRVSQQCTTQMNIWIDVAHRVWRHKTKWFLCTLVCSNILHAISSGKDACSYCTCAQTHADATKLLDRISLTYVSLCYHVMFGISVRDVLALVERCTYTLDALAKQYFQRKQNLGKCLFCVLLVKEIVEAGRTTARGRQYPYTVALLGLVRVVV